MFKVLWPDVSNAAVSVYLVDGTEQREIYPDFVEGGNDMAYDGLRRPFTLPPGEVFVELDSDLLEMKCWLLHELHERRLMIAGLDYDEAHIQANVIESQARKKPAILDELIKRELELALTLSGG
jgi:hypothetical protein